MFKENDYIIVLNTYSDDVDFKVNYIFKQRRYLEYLSVYLDCEDQMNGWGKIKFKSSDMWRYATEDEIEEYERIGKPFDVTTLKPKIKEDYSYLNALFEKLNIN